MGEPGLAASAEAGHPDPVPLARSLEDRTSPPRRAGLAAFVRAIGDFAVTPGPGGYRRATPVRPDPFLQIVLTGEHRLRHVARGQVVRSRRATLIGICTRRTYDLDVEAPLAMMCIQFQPGALHALLGLDCARLTDSCRDATRVFGADVLDLADRLADIPDAGGRQSEAEAWLAGLPWPSLGAIARNARAIADGSAARLPPPPPGLSARHYQRRFAREVGVSAMRYARLSRLAHAVQVRAATPTMSWTHLAHAAGYADQSHFSREFRAIAGATPSGWAANA